MKQAVMAAALCLLAGRAHGVRPAPHDLASLVLLSDFIVLVDQSERETEPGGSKVVWCRVTKTYKGSVLPGEVFARPTLDSYLIDRTLLGEESSRQMEALFFLNRIGGRKDWDSFALEVVPSGVRLLMNGAVYSPYQWKNPGGFVPRPEKSPDDGSEIRLADLEKSLKAAILRVAALEQT